MRTRSRLRTLGLPNGCECSTRRLIQSSLSVRRHPRLCLDWPFIRSIVTSFRSPLTPQTTAGLWATTINWTWASRRRPSVRAYSTCRPSRDPAFGPDHRHYILARTLQTSSSGSPSTSRPSRPSRRSGLTTAARLTRRRPSPGGTLSTAGRRSPRQPRGRRRGRRRWDGTCRKAIFHQKLYVIARCPILRHAIQD